MDPFDAVAVRRVWQRVRQTEDALSDERQGIETLIAAEDGAQRTYRRLAGMNRAYAGLLQRLAAQEGEHARRLRALFFLLWGAPPAVQLPAPRKSGEFSQELREAYRAELESAHAYEQMAQQMPGHEAFFRELAQEERQHAAQLRQIAARMV